MLDLAAEVIIIMNDCCGRLAEIYVDFGILFYHLERLQTPIDTPNVLNFRKKGQPES